MSEEKDAAIHNLLLQPANVNPQVIVVMCKKAQPTTIKLVGNREQKGLRNALTSDSGKSAGPL